MSFAIPTIGLDTLTTIDPTTVTGIGEASETEANARGVTRATKVTRTALPDVYSPWTVGQVIAAMDADESTTRLTQAALGADTIDGAGAGLANLAGVTKTITRPGTYLIKAYGMVGGVVAATAAAIASLAVDGAAQGTPLDIGVGGFVVNAKAERGISLISSVTVAGVAKTVTLQGGNGAGTAARFFGVGIEITPLD